MPWRCSPTGRALAAELLDDSRPGAGRGRAGSPARRSRPGPGVDHPRMARARHPFRRAGPPGAGGDRHRRARRPGHRGAAPRCLQDPDLEVARAACRAAGLLKNRAYLFELVDALGNPRLRADAIAALAAYGPAICGTLSDVLVGRIDLQPIRRQVPRVLKAIPHQRSVDVLLACRRASGSRHPRRRSEGPEPPAGDRSRSEFRYTPSSPIRS